MMFVSVFRACLLAGLLGCAPGVAVAATHGLPKNKPVVSVIVPDDWKTASDRFFIKATPASEAFYVSFLLVPMGNFTQAMKDWENWLARMKITRDEASKIVQKFRFEGEDSIVSRWKASDADGPTGVKLTILKLGKENLLFITHWGSQAAEKKYAQEILAIQHSVTKRK